MRQIYCIINVDYFDDEEIACIVQNCVNDMRNKIGGYYSYLKVFMDPVFEADLVIRMFYDHDYEVEQEQLIKARSIAQRYGFALVKLADI